MLYRGEGGNLPPSVTVMGSLAIYPRPSPWVSLETPQYKKKEPGTNTSSVHPGKKRLMILRDGLDVCVREMPSFNWARSKILACKTLT